MTTRIFAVLFCIALPACCQDAEAVLNRYVQVTGGAALYKRYNAYHFFYTMTGADKASRNVDLFHARDGRTFIETDDGKQTIDSGISDGVAWKYSQSGGAKILSGASSARMIAEWKGFDEDDWQARFPKVSSLTNQPVNGAPCRHLKLTRADGSTVERWYEIKSGLLVKEVGNAIDDSGMEHPVTTEFERYDTYFGIRRPANWRITYGSQSFEVQINSVMYSESPERAIEELPHDVVRAIIAARGTPNGLPNPVDLIDKFVQATGGKDAYRNVKTEVVKGDVALVKENVTFPVVTYIAGNKSYSVADMPSIGKLESGDDGQTAWEKSVVTGPKLKPHSGQSEYMAPGPELISMWSQSAVNMRTVSQDEVNGAACYVVSLDPASDEGPKACFDVKSGLLVKLSAKTTTGVYEQSFSDYRDVKGYMMCYRIDTNEGDQVTSLRVSNVAINEPLPANVFELPPDVKALKAKRDAAQAKIPVNPDAPNLKRTPPN